MGRRRQQVAPPENRENSKKRGDSAQVPGQGEKGNIWLATVERSRDGCLQIILRYPAHNYQELFPKLLIVTVH